MSSVGIKLGQAKFISEFEAVHTVRVAGTCPNPDCQQPFDVTFDLRENPRAQYRCKCGTLMINPAQEAVIIDR